MEDVNNQVVMLSLVSVSGTCAASDFVLCMQILGALDMVVRVAGASVAVAGSGGQMPDAGMDRDSVLFGSGTEYPAGEDGPDGKGDSFNAGRGRGVPDGDKENKFRIAATAE